MIVNVGKDMDTASDVALRERRWQRQSEIPQFRLRLDLDFVQPPTSAAQQCEKINRLDLTGKAGDYIFCSRYGLWTCHVGTSTSH